MLSAQVLVLYSNYITTTRLLSRQAKVKGKGNTVVTRRKHFKKRGGGLPPIEPVCLPSMLGGGTPWFPQLLPGPGQ